MANTRKVRMKRWAQPTLVLELEPGDVVDLPAYVADQFIDNGTAEPVSAESALETAALGSGRRRG